MSRRGVVLAAAGCLVGCVAARQAPCDERKQALTEPEEGFAWLEAHALERPPDTDGGVDDVRLVDIDADGRSDVVLNHRGFQNRVFVSRAGYCGSFAPFEEATIDGPVADDQSWPEADLTFADLDRDDRPELVWSLRDGAQNVVYVGRFDASEPLRLAVSGGGSLGKASSSWDVYQPVVGDVDNDGRDDLVWTTTQRTDAVPGVCVFSAFGAGVKGLMVPGPEQCFDLDDIFPHRNGVLAIPFLADANYDAREELLLNFNQNSPLVVLSVLFDVVEQRFFRGEHSLRSGGEWNLRFGPPMVGDMDGAFGVDMAWLKSDGSQVLTTLSDRAGALVTTLGPVDVEEHGTVVESWVALQDHDDLVDLVVMSSVDKGLEVSVWYGTTDGRFGGEEGVVAPPDRRGSVPAQPEEGARLERADIDGDGLGDLAWFHLDDTRVQVQVGLSVAEAP